VKGREEIQAKASKHSCGGSVPVHSSAPRAVQDPSMFQLKPRRLSTIIPSIKTQRNEFIWPVNGHIYPRMSVLAIASSTCSRKPDVELRDCENPILLRIVAGGARDSGHVA